LVVEGLRTMVNDFIMEGTIKSIRMGNTLSLSHLLFVDDVILLVLSWEGKKKGIRKL